MFQHIESKIGLHQTLEVDYTVTGYLARIVNEKEETIIGSEGETIYDALENLDMKLEKIGD